MHTIISGFSKLASRGRKKSTGHDGDMSSPDNSPERVPPLTPVNKKRTSLSNLLGRSRKNSTDNDKGDLSSLDNSPERVPPVTPATKKRTSITGGNKELKLPIFMYKYAIYNMYLIDGAYNIHSNIQRFVQSSG
jgi:hypothetical protein